MPNTPVHVKVQLDQPEDRLTQLLAKCQDGEIFEITHDANPSRPVAVMMSFTDYETLMGALTRTQPPTATVPPRRGAGW